jgi:toxin CptA
MTSVPDIGFDYRPSRWPQGLLLTLGVLALVATWTSRLMPGLALVVSVMVIHYVWSSLRRMRHVPVNAATWRCDGGWSLVLVDGETVEARLADSRVVAGAVLIRLAWEPRREAWLALFPDNLAADARRRLRMRLSASPDNG